jgi:hypothetical protein
MTAAAVIALLQAIATGAPAIIQLANELKSTFSTTDQSTIESLIATIMANADGDVSQAEADLNAAS